MTDEEKEEHWIRGHRAATVAMLGHCLRELGYDPDELVKQARLAYEREQTIAVLRRVCEEHGDNDWEPTLHLADVVDKHLARHLPSHQSGEGS